MIGVLAAAPRDMDREAGGLQQVVVPGAGPRGVERRMLQQPDQLARLARSDVGDTRLHRRESLFIRHGCVGKAPFRPIFRGGHGRKVGISRSQRKSRSTRLATADPIWYPPGHRSGAAMAELVDALA